MNRLRACMEDLYLEVFPDPRIHEALLALPEGSHLGLTCSPKKGLDATLALMTRLQGHHFHVIPHVAARQVRDRSHLTDIVHQLNDQSIQALFVPGGDIAAPVGAYDSALALLRDLAEIGHNLKDIGVAAHPEGHPQVGGDDLRAALLAKQEFATYMVTQMCFDVPLMMAWLRGLRADGVHMPAWIGLPGVMDRFKLFRTALRIGVGESARFARKQKSLTGALLSSSRYTPDDLLDEIAPSLADPSLDIGGFYLFSFNQLEDTLNWRRDQLLHLAGEIA